MSFWCPFLNTRLAIYHLSTGVQLEKSDHISPTYLIQFPSLGALQANLLTGAVNMSMHTIFVAPAKAFATLLLYMAVLVGCMGVADKKKLRLKFW